MPEPDPSHFTATNAAVRFGAGISTSDDGLAGARHAADIAAESLRAQRAGSADLCFVFVSKHHHDVAGAIADAVGDTLAPRHVIGVSAESVIAGVSEHERAPGVSVLAASMPGVEIATFDDDGLAVPGDAEPTDAIAEHVGLERDAAATFMFLDPYSVPTVKLLPALNRARAMHAPNAPLIGGIASSGNAPGQNALVLDGDVQRDGLVGVTLRGPIQVDTVVSQGCRPVGRNLVITKAQRNLILELGGKPALETVREMVQEMPPADRAAVGKGLFLGTVIDEYKDRFGRGDFLVRNIIGVDENHGALAVADLVRTGQTVRLHTRDAQTASEDLGLLLDGQVIHGQPAGAMLITCNGRGTRLFDTPNHDAEAIARAFGPHRAGEEMAKGGEPIAPPEPTVPLAGFAAAGEIGPIGDASYLHGHTACLALFRNA